MILAIDIGNTTTAFGTFERGKLASTFSMATHPDNTPDDVTLELKAHAKSRRLHLRQARRIILCSVVPQMSSVLIEALRSLAKADGKKARAIPLCIVGQDVKVPLINRYTYPEQVGQDRLVGAYAAWHAYGAPLGRPKRRHPKRARQDKPRDPGGRDVIVADFGTANTIDVVTRAGEYLGGVITPGIQISLEALASRTALLPKVELREPPELLGRDTANSIRSGILYGFAALCDGLVTQLKRRYAPGATVVATGGASPLVAKYARTIEHLRPNLVLEGLYQLASECQ
jgi:type III pantothenate kinase